MSTRIICLFVEIRNTSLIEQLFELDTGVSMNKEAKDQPEFHP